MLRGSSLGLHLLLPSLLASHLLTFIPDAKKRISDLLSACVLPRREEEEDGGGEAATVVEIERSGDEEAGFCRTPLEREDRL